MCINRSRRHEAFKGYPTQYYVGGEPGHTLNNLGIGLGKQSEVRCEKDGTPHHVYDCTEEQLVEIENNKADLGFAVSLWCSTDNGRTIQPWPLAYSPESERLKGIELHRKIITADTLLPPNRPQHTFKWR